MDPALLLNATYEPIQIVSWRKAITLYLLEKAEVVEKQDYEIHSADASYPMPSVLRLYHRVEVPRRNIQFSRINVYRRDGFQCQYCGVEFSVDDLTFDHVFPQSRGGGTNWTNIVTCCGPCNRQKGDRTPEEAGMTLESEPRKPQWWPFTESSCDFDKHPDDWHPYLWT
jgi:5-methylcytosine-specific restriction endonuclease McrA